MDFLDLIRLVPDGPFVTLPVWLAWFTGVLAGAIALMAFLRIRPPRKEYRDLFGTIINHTFLFVTAGYLLVIFRLNKIPGLSMGLLLLLWHILFFWYLYTRYIKWIDTTRLVSRKIANARERELQKKSLDPYVAAHQAPKKKKKR